ncbi:hypothetical protein CLAFUW4_14162 [Fulvia fulva]|uniref:Uncharacterized protein n=1 Tax=Passalora fulva TaxID=5499 RepID=A0A9Q8PKU5_PASFU|nr:uncharacterized protein CLAFUR5_13996 [Fulvia fulva]KAK4610607.1 hypothetical protein CLAFUR4_14165 [Fulvia fulva]KAK4610926.1 hypothetical protein CLAFUR0_14169 [Fulvia fulva]UJO24286.1 hypothetical protein CLAFUR5_13996 [Fulvia fulva]WPV22282.1 hypothetical protein CLAFUW4_14162 [Fulvia fulva]WPV37159.1 hypothetical protein CLAFUW7_14173 [Fulvia fulva]
MAGRAVENTFRDLRSASKARKRKRKASRKYYGWKYIKTGQLNAPHLDMEHHDAFRPLWESALPAEAETITMTKAVMYRQAQRWPRPPTYHRQSKEKEIWPWSFRIERRRELQKHPNVDFKDPWTVYYDSLFSESDSRDDWDEVYDL